MSSKALRGRHRHRRRLGDQQPHPPKPRHQHQGPGRYRAESGRVPRQLAWHVRIGHRRLRRHRRQCAQCRHVARQARTRRRGPGGNRDLDASLGQRRGRQRDDGTHYAGYVITSYYLTSQAVNVPRRAALDKSVSFVALVAQRGRQVRGQYGHRQERPWGGLDLHQRRRI